jgi:hypothetical protein
MRSIALVAAVALSGLTQAHAQSSFNADAYFNNAIKPHLDAYVLCAARHLEIRAKADPEKTFGQVEASLRPACGGNIDRAREAMTRVGMTTADVNGIIRRWYTSIQGEVRTSYERHVLDVNRQREAARLQLERERQAKETDAERNKILGEATAEHIDCLKKEMVNIVPFSSEGAETLGNVIMTKCADHERKRVSLVIALFGIQRSNAERILKKIADETRKLIVAEIVTFRANLAKSQTEGQRSGQQPARAGTGI